MASNSTDLRFAATAIVKGKAYPALAQHSARPYTKSWHQFRHHWPYTVPCELHEHCATHRVDHSIGLLEQAQSGDFFTIGLGFFDFDIDYISLIPQQVWDQQLKILFYYHEGDNPGRIQQRLDKLCQLHGRDPDCYRFVSGNTAADHLDRFAWFPDHELLYWHRNRSVTPTSIHLNARTHRFTILNRTHKWWRATVMADLQRHGVLDHSLWSYNTAIAQGDDMLDNPLELDTLNLREAVQKFIEQGPYSCDQLTADDHNNHHLHVPEHYANSYCHIVVETHFDADQSGGAFLTEKVFKPIKHGQPFVVAGAPGTLATLRKMGYRTFDHVIDNSYDLETDNTRRWQMLMKSIQQIQNQDPDAWFAQCLDDVCHNQNLFVKPKTHRLNMLSQRLLQL